SSSHCRRVKTIVRDPATNTTPRSSSIHDSKRDRHSVWHAMPVAFEISAYRN
ncbi:unnamed protein product, partial [Sphacelaria rigidula]